MSVETTADTKNTITNERILSYRTLYFNVVITISSAFSPVMKKSLRVALGDSPHQWRWPTVTTAGMHHPPVTELTSTVWSPEMFSKHWWMSTGTIFFLMDRGIHWHTFASMSDAIASDCPSAAICHMATTYNEILVFNLCYCTTNIQHCELT